MATTLLMSMGLLVAGFHDRSHPGMGTVILVPSGLPDFSSNMTTFDVSLRGFPTPHMARWPTTRARFFTPATATRTMSPTLAICVGV